MFEKVLVAIDGSKYSESALEAAADAARQGRGEVRVVHVREVTSPVPPIETPDDAVAILDTGGADLKDHGVEVSGVLRQAKPGHVATEILAEAHEWGAGVVVIASRELSSLAGIVFGSTTHKVLHLSDLPVQVVH